MENALNPIEASNLIGCSEYTIRKLAREKRIPYYKAGKNIRFRLKSLERWMERQERENYLKD